MSDAQREGRERRPFEVVIWGATGFTGRLTAEYLLAEYGVGAGLRWAIGGRNREKLARVRDQLGEATGRDASALAILVGDSEDEVFLEDLARRTNVVCSTVGPYARYGSKLVKTCAEQGTDYCDLTGEVHWMQQMIDSHQEAAEKSGARVVFSCGFDCVPSDLGVFFLQREMKAKYGVACAKIQMRVKGFKGGASGGTIASLLSMLEQAERDPSVDRPMREPYSLNPRGERTGPDGPETIRASYDEDFSQWTTPFVMGTINTKVVRRSNALLDYAYGKDFRYDEAMLMGAGAGGMARAALMSTGAAAMMGAMSTGWIRRAVSGWLTQPGNGPSKAQQEAGFFDLLLRGTSADGRVLGGRVRGDRDPGYGSTSKMLGESAVCLAQDPVVVGGGRSTMRGGLSTLRGGLSTLRGGLSTLRGGLSTPASALGEALLRRLPRAGVRFEIED